MYIRQWIPTEPSSSPVGRLSYLKFLVGFLYLSYEYGQFVLAISNLGRTLSTSPEQCPRGPELPGPKPSYRKFLKLQIWLATMESVSWRSCSVLFLLNVNHQRTRQTELQMENVRFASQRRNMNWIPVHCHPGEETCRMHKWKAFTRKKTRCPTD